MEQMAPDGFKKSPQEHRPSDRRLLQQNMPLTDVPSSAPVALLVEPMVADCACEPCRLDAEATPAHQTRHTELLIWSSEETTTLKEHDAMFDFIERGDSQRAEAAMRTHLDRSRDLYRHRG
jgi:hypothetical protein